MVILRQCIKCGESKPRTNFATGGNICMTCKIAKAETALENRDRTRKATLRLAQKMSTKKYNQGLEEEYHL